MSYFSPINILIYFLSITSIALSSSSYRLSQGIYPTSYNITLHPYFDDLTIEAYEYIHIRMKRDHLSSCEESSIQITINVRDLTIRRCRLYLYNNNHIIYDMKSHDYDFDSQTVTFDFDLSVAHALTVLHNQENQDYLSAILYLDFKGEMQTEMNGLYITSYKHNGHLIHNAITHFEATNARRLFPCFDEPMFKAIFTLNVFVPEPAIVLSNTPLKYKETTNKHDCPWRSHTGHTTACKLLRFETTPIMSTYLVALAIGDYEYVSGKSGHIFQRIYFPIQKHIRAKFALETTLSIMPYYEHIFDMTYKLPKMYSLAVSDFKMGAMENWGMVTYRDIRLLVDPSHSTLMDVMQVASVIAHEEAHQWFGNLVTMKWWNHIWLNEGFAAYFQTIGAQHAYPNMNFWDIYYYDTHRAMLLDCSHETHAIVVDEACGNGEVAIKPKDIRSLFDGITYHKGAGFLHMLSEYFGPQNFMNGLQAYLYEYQYSNAETNDLFEILADHAIAGNEHMVHEKLIQMMNDWVLNIGLPIIKVTLDLNENGIILHLEQNRLIPNLRSQTKLNMDQLWNIPLRVRNCQSLIDNKQLFGSASLQLKMDRIQCSGMEYYIINPEMRSLFRTNYDTKSLNLIIYAFDKLSKVDQFSIVSDRFSLLMFNYISAGNYISFVSSVVNQIGDDVNYLLWRLIIETFIHIDDIYCEFFHSPDMNLQLLRKDFRYFAKVIIHKIWKSIGKWDGNGSDSFVSHSEESDEAHDHVLLRPLILSALIRFEDEEIIDTGYHLLLKIMDEHHRFSVTKEGYFNANINANVLQAILEAGLSKMDSNEHSCTRDTKLIYNNLLYIYSDANTEVQTVILGAIGAVYRDPYMLQRAINFVLSPKVRRNVKGHGFGSLRRCYGRGIVWKNMLKRSRGAPRQAGMASTFANIKVYREINDYYFNNDGKRTLIHSKVRVVRSILEKIMLNNKFLNYNKEKTAVWLRDYVCKHNGGCKRRKYNSNVVVGDLMDDEIGDVVADGESDGYGDGFAGFDGSDDDFGTLDMDDIRNGRLADVKNIYDGKLAVHYFDKYHFENDDFGDGKISGIVRTKAEQKAFEDSVHKVFLHEQRMAAWESLMLMLTLFFVVVACCLIALWLYSVHKNTLVI